MRSEATRRTGAGFHLLLAGYEKITRIVSCPSVEAQHSIEMVRFWNYVADLWDRTLARQLLMAASRICSSTIGLVTYSSKPRAR